MKINTIIFDLDGTLLNTLEDLKNSTNFALMNFGYEEKTLAEIKEFVGNGVTKLIERAIPNGLKNKDFDKCLKTFKEHYSQNMNNNTKPYPGIIEILTTLKRNDYKIAVVSNKYDSAVKELCNKYFGELIDIAIGENVDVKKKPAPDSVLKALEELKSSNNGSVYVGDSEVDIQTAKNAKLPCISVTWGFKTKAFLLQNGAIKIIDTPPEIFNEIY